LLEELATDPDAAPAVAGDDLVASLPPTTEIISIRDLYTPACRDGCAFKAEAPYRAAYSEFCGSRAAV
jgi:hypothetical protein